MVLLTVLLPIKHLGLSGRLSSHFCQSNDVYAKAARSVNYRCRSAFKLLQIEESFNVFKDKCRIIDLGAAPGSWSQVATRLAHHKPPTVSVISVDVTDFDPILGTVHLPYTNAEDFVDIHKAMKSVWKDMKPQLVLSDIHHVIDADKNLNHFNSIKICSTVINFCFSYLEDNGCVVMNIYSGPHEMKLIMLLKKYFKFVHKFKPDACHKLSNEYFIVAIAFQKGLYDKKLTISTENESLYKELK